MYEYRALQAPPAPPAPPSQPATAPPNSSSTGASSDTAAATASSSASSTSGGATPQGNQVSQPPPAAPPPQPPRVNPHHLQQLFDMGFSQEQGEEALLACGDNLTAAMDWLLSRPTPSGPAVGPSGCGQGCGLQRIISGWGLLLFIGACWYGEWACVRWVWSMRAVMFATACEMVLVWRLHDLYLST